MNKRNMSNICLLLLLFLATVIYRTFIIKHLLKYAESITAAMMILIVFISIALLGFRKNKQHILKKTIINITIIQIILFFSISYGIGLFVGFLKNAYSLKLYSIIDNVFAPIIIIICTEIFRYIIISANKDKKYICIISTIIITIFELVISIRGCSLNDYAGIFKIVTSKALPIISKNMVLSYLTYQVGYTPALIYRLVMDVYIFVLPIIPDLGEYINSMIGICLPFLLYIYTSRVINEYYNGIEHDFKTRSFELTDIPLLAFIVLIVCLISGAFPYSMIGIGSGSMSPNINKGDAVIIHKVESKSELKEGDVIAFNQDGKTVVHRLVKIENVKGKVHYTTKGDANPTNDNNNLKFKDIKGIVKLKIKYIAYPSVYLSENFSKEKK